MLMRCSMMRYITWRVEVFLVSIALKILQEVRRKTESPRQMFRNRRLRTQSSWCGLASTKLPLESTLTAVRHYHKCQSATKEGTYFKTSLILFLRIGADWP